MTSKWLTFKWLANDLVFVDWFQNDFSMTCKWHTWNVHDSSWYLCFPCLLLSTTNVSRCLRDILSSPLQIGISSLPNRSCTQESNTFLDLNIATLFANKRFCPNGTNKSLWSCESHCLLAHWRSLRAWIPTRKLSFFGTGFVSFSHALFSATGMRNFVRFTHGPVVLFDVIWSVVCEMRDIL